MTISVGDKLPETEFFVMTADGPSKKPSAELFSGKKIVLFAVPGAFTPTCHMKHMPGFVANADAIKAKGADDIICVTVNDPFVAAEWAKQSGADGKVTVVADAAADFTKAIGIEMDGSGFGLGIRYKRYAAIVEDGTVTTLIIEEDPGKAEQTAAEEILKQL